MSTNAINILVSFDKGYIKPFHTMLKSLVTNNPHETIHIWLLHSSISSEELQDLGDFCDLQGVSLTPIQVDSAIFKKAPVSKQYPQEMYYRLLAPHLLPSTLDRILYLDPDILVINSIRPLWEMSLNEYIFAAASHIGVTNIINGVNRIRLGTNHDYFNTGVLLMNLKVAREVVKAEDIFQCVSNYKGELILPDQDVFNFLYGSLTLAIDDAIWNYDARYYTSYMIRSGGDYDLDWVMKNTVILHFCGKRKPWAKSYSYRFATLYKHYMNAIFR
ncbi:glycosyltransferase family 8 protein [Granulicatella seriolae]|uniref:Glycosyltransferase family 8 protein n=1 Tax=Granulicatella seriolae TaxID=2967226 RepID=A0ABT1WLH6_9LACT|nr:glycosyltransferase family 8 protein [Granulicatella seriolae]